MSKKVLNALFPGLVYGVCWAMHPYLMVGLHVMAALAVAGAVTAVVLRRLTRKRLPC